MAEMIPKVYEVDPMTCPKCGGQMKIVAFITKVSVVDRFIDNPKLGFVHLLNELIPTGSLSDPRGRCITSSCYLSHTCAGIFE